MTAHLKKHPIIRSQEHNIVLGTEVMIETHVAANTIKMIPRG